MPRRWALLGLLFAGCTVPPTGTPALKPASVIPASRCIPDTLDGSWRTDYRQAPGDEPLPYQLELRLGDGELSIHLLRREADGFVSQPLLRRWVDVGSTHSPLWSVPGSGIVAFRPVEDGGDDTLSTPSLAKPFTVVHRFAGLDTPDREDDAVASVVEFPEGLPVSSRDVEEIAASVHDRPMLATLQNATRFVRQCPLTPTLLEEERDREHEQRRGWIGQAHAGFEALHDSLAQLRELERSIAEHRAILGEGRIDAGPPESPQLGERDAWRLARPPLDAHHPQYGAAIAIVRRDWEQPRVPDLEEFEQRASALVAAVASESTSAPDVLADLDALDRAHRAVRERCAERSRVLSAYREYVIAYRQ